MELFAKLKRRLASFRLSKSSLSDVGASEAEIRVGQMQTLVPKLTVRVAKGNCGLCGFNRANGGYWPDVAGDDQTMNTCTIRGIHIANPLATYCQNFDSRDPAPFGALFNILPSHGNSCAPWVGLSAPREGKAMCCICNWPLSHGILLHLPEADVGACGPEHYLEWWSDYLRRWLMYFTALGEKAYSDMYDVTSYSAGGYYSDAKAAFHDAIRTARDLELADEARALESRLAHIQEVFRSQFR
jgi:hypothetical protein